VRQGYGGTKKYMAKGNFSQRKEKKKPKKEKELK
jgi:hypothetical protein